jgi:putative ABC transport system substrate-binding protein
MAEELVRLKVDVIVTLGTPATRAAQQATRTIPIVFGAAGDPVGSGLVKSLSRPGGNITGRSLLTTDIAPKLLDILLGVAPKVSSVAYLANPENASGIGGLKNVQTVAQKYGIRILSFEVTTAGQIDDAFGMMSAQKAEAVIVSLDSLFMQQRRRIADLAAKHRLLSIAATREYAEAGGLMGYGQVVSDNFRRVASYVDRIFKGAKPADLPVEQPTTFEFVVNLKTAKMLGITIPEKVLLRADQVIE